MKLKKLFKRLKELKPKRKNYYIEPTIRFEVDDRNYLFCFIPTIIYTPWIYRHPHIKEAILDICWLNMHILIGTWCVKEEE